MALIHRNTLTAAQAFTRPPGESASHAGQSHAATRTQDALEAVVSASTVDTRTAIDMEQRAIRAIDVNQREQLRVLSHGFSSAAQVCSGLIPA